MSSSKLSTTDDVCYDDEVYEEDWYELINNPAMRAAWGFNVFEHGKRSKQKFSSMESADKDV